ncbi:MAG: hypothetical protein L6R41_002828 [Letrouitia leprolyta]|nr:MAG: hypothetical protein L6R41_002828 [Letrouitia leprolyta]
MASSVETSRPSDCEFSVDNAEQLGLIRAVNMTGNAAGLGAALGTVTYAGIASAVKLQKAVSCFSPAIIRKFKDTLAWIYAHPGRAATILCGTTILGLTLAAPAILGAVGFGALGPVAGSTAAGWQSSTGLVAAGSAFSFLQGAAMGGVAMGVITGVGIVGGAVPIVAALAPKAEIVKDVLKDVTVGVHGVVENTKDVVAGAVGNVGGIVGGMMEGVPGTVENVEEVVDGAVGKVGDVVGGMVEGFMGLFGKKKED